MLDVLDDELQIWKFNGTFRDYSPYKGPPNADVDKAWADLFSCSSFLCWLTYPSFLRALLRALTWNTVIRSWRVSHHRFTPSQNWRSANRSSIPCRGGRRLPWVHGSSSSAALRGMFHPVAQSPGSPTTNVSPSSIPRLTLETEQFMAVHI